MNDQSPTARDRDDDERPETDDRTEPESQPDERNAEEQPKGHGPLKGTDTAATVNAEDVDKARRITM